MKKYCSELLIVACTVTVANAYFSLPLLAKWGSTWISQDWVNKSGPLGDTFGGLLSPIIGVVSIFLIYKTFVTQREQHNVSVINQTMQAQIARIDESIRTVNFTFARQYKQNVCGYNGLFEFNETYSTQKVNEYYSPISSETVSQLVHNNINPLTEVYDKVSATVVLIDRLMNSYNIEATQQDEWRRILLLNLGENFRVNVDHIADYIDWYTEHTSEIDIIYDSVNQISRLRQLVNTVRTFYIQALSDNPLPSLRR